MNKKEPIKKSNYIIFFIYRIMICIILVLTCLILLKTKTISKDELEKYVYQNQFNFAYFKNTYNKYLGGVLPLDNVLSTTKVFNEKLSYKSHKKYKSGCKLEVDDSYLVPSLDSGIVVYIGEKDDYGNVIIVQQNNGIDTWYGNIDSSLSMYDYIEKGELIGTAQKNYIYLYYN